MRHANNSHTQLKFSRVFSPLLQYECPWELFEQVDKFWLFAPSLWPFSFFAKLVQLCRFLQGFATSLLFHSSRSFEGRIDQAILIRQLDGKFIFVPICIQVHLIPGVLRPHCKENPNYVFLFQELRGLTPSFHIHVSMSDLYNPRISLHISLQQNRQTDPGNI